MKADTVASFCSPGRGITPSFLSCDTLKKPRRILRSYCLCSPHEREHNLRGRPQEPSEAAAGIPLPDDREQTWPAMARPSCHLDRALIEIQLGPSQSSTFFLWGPCLQDNVKDILLSLSVRPDRSYKSVYGSNGVAVQPLSIRRSCAVVFSKSGRNIRVLRRYAAHHRGTARGLMFPPLPVGQCGTAATRVP